MSKTTLYSLIVAIDVYDPSLTIGGNLCFHPLQGCVRDAKALHEWLAADPDFELKSVTLYNQDATKSNIAKAFRDHLSQARAGDSVLFFYSGHGTQELADMEVWTEETDTYLEGLACYYDKGNTQNFILADKELRYLLHSISKPGVHIATLFDCCHSGDNTRAAMGEPLILKQGYYVFPQRPWDHFLFAKQHPRDSVIGKRTRDFLPEGDYVALSAAESDQSAVETAIGGERHGVFAFHLLHVLRQCGGNISYRDLTNQVRNRIRFKYSQRTKIFASRDYLYEDGFLQKKLPDPSTAVGTVTFNPYTNQYRLDRGILARVMPNSTRVQARTPEGQILQGRVGAADLNTADVIFSASDLAALEKPVERMSVTLDRLAGKPLRIYFHNKDLTDQEANSVTAFLFSDENQAYIVPESEEERSDYTLLAWAGMYYLTLKGDWFRPVVLPLHIEEDDALKKLLSYLQQMASWHFFKDLSNQGHDAISQDLLQIDIMDGQGSPFQIQDNVLTSPLRPTGQVDKFGRNIYETELKIQVTNRSNKNLYVAAHWFSDFGIYASAIGNPDGTRPIPAGKSEVVEIFGSKTITLELDDTTRLFHKPYGASEFKFIYATEPFESKMLDEESLPTPDLLSTRSKNIKVPTTDEAERTWPSSGWNSRNIEIRTLNPEFEMPDLRELEHALDRKMGDPDLGHFLTGIYFQKKPGTATGLELKKELDVLEKGGVFMDGLMAAANYWANFRRNNHYSKMVRKDSTQPKIVSEGDSWFQHPLLDDIIDHVGRFYPTYCLAAAGDTIRNYFAENEIADAVKKIKPVVLLLSGGGNDILGEDLPRFLKDTFEDAPEGQHPERFFKDSFRAELDAIMEMYRTIFDFLKVEYPDLKIVTHSYDYPRPVEYKSKKRNWIGQYLDEKGIERPGDRSALVRYMLNQFNLRLKNLSDEYPGCVFHLDLRKSVRDDQWDDEIHPNNVGFQNVSVQFIRVITTLVQKPDV
ncbi:MAG: caspase family protein, partial [Saprospiraceae bacterium]|nr:caspase family protein [Saprospiraceae bacterium]